MAKFTTLSSVLLGAMVFFVILSFFFSKDLNPLLFQIKFEIFNTPGVDKSDYLNTIEGEGPPPRLVTVMLTFDRPESLLRSLNSLERSYYQSSDNKSQNHLLKISIDVPKQNGTTKKWNSATTRRNNKKCLEIAEDFVWTHGEKQISLRARNAGLAAQWFESWTPYVKPGDDDDYFVHIVEDDLEYSPYYYKFIWDVQSNLHLFQDPSIAQICLTGIGGPDDPLVRIHPSVNESFTCSWGAVWKASELRNFELWLLDNYNRIKPYTYGVFNRWIDEGRDLQSVWTARYLKESKKKFLTFNLKRNTTITRTAASRLDENGDGHQIDRDMYDQVMKENVALVINHAEVGVNYKKKGPRPNPKTLVSQTYQDPNFYQDPNLLSQLKNEFLGDVQTTLFTNKEWVTIKQQLQQQREEMKKKNII